MESRAEVEGGRPPFHVHEDSLTHSRSQQAQSVARDSKKCVVYDRPSQIYSFADGEPRDANQTPIKNAVPRELQKYLVLAYACQPKRNGNIVAGQEPHRLSGWVNPFRLQMQTFESQAAARMLRLSLAFSPIRLASSMCTETSLNGVRTGSVPTTTIRHQPQILVARQAAINE